MAITYLDNGIPDGITPTLNVYDFYEITEYICLRYALDLKMARDLLMEYIKKHHNVDGPGIHAVSTFAFSNYVAKKAGANEKINLFSLALSTMAIDKITTDEILISIAHW